MIWSPTKHRGFLRRDFLRGAIAGGAASAVPAWLQLHPTAAGAASPTVREDISIFQQDAGKVRRLEAAIQEMQARSAADVADPKGWLRNATAHADFCATPGPSDPSQIHFCWWFLSWHRAFITVTERKLRVISGDASITFPYWNWSSDRQIPMSFAKGGSPLSSAMRNIPPRPVVNPEVDYFPADPAKAKFGVAALEAKTFQATTVADIGKSFGGIARPNTSGRYGNNRLEGVPHGPIHNYIGGDMADFQTAARDPIFFAHHGNLDRLWEIWRKDATKKATEPNTQAFLKHAFPFTWLDGTTIVITVEETLDTTRLGYVYDSLDVFRTAATAMEPTQNEEAALPPIAKAEVSVPAAAQGPAGETNRYDLVIQGIQAPAQTMTVGVYLKSVDDQQPGPGIAVGSFAAVRSGGQIVFPEDQLKFDITEVLKRIRTEKISVSLVPYALGNDANRQYPPLKYESMQISIGQ
jgi:Common central domain of tyrosinase